jgi:hypothetical protein
VKEILILCPLEGRPDLLEARFFSLSSVNLKASLGKYPIAKAQNQK